MRKPAFTMGESPGLAQWSQSSSDPRPRLISLDEGMAVIGAALEIRYRRHPREDCSHLVHGIYKQAGFAYKYADSSELYGGIDAFQRVTQPQPGDLAVWKGHAAIVVNPAQHTFFSSTRTGLRVESYDLKYWKRRGTPRFYRYVTFAPPLPSILQTSGAEPSN
jgi:cell wall-associated NlpC family hydrolase